MLGTVPFALDPRAISHVGVVPDEHDDAPRSSARPRMSVETEARLRNLVESHHDFIWRSLRGLGVSSGEVDDATQQVFWIASRKLGAIALGSERAFLFATARGIAANVRRSRARRQEDFDEDALARRMDESADPEQAAAKSQARAILEGLLDEMDEDLRTVFVLFELEGLTTASIADLLAIPMGTVASRLRRARELFERQTASLHAVRGGAR